jgi:DNA-binding response OmpR family regulator
VRFALGDLGVDPDALRLTGSDRRERLTPIEGRPLGYLVRHAERVVPRDDAAVKRLRNKVERRVSPPPEWTS